MPQPQKTLSALLCSEMENWQSRITTDPKVCHGNPCIRGTRVLVSVVLDNLSDGLTAAEIVEEYPALTPDDVRAALGYASELARKKNECSSAEYQP